MADLWAELLDQVQLGALLALGLAHMWVLELVEKLDQVQ